MEGNQTNEESAVATTSLCVPASITEQRDQKEARPGHTVYRSGNEFSTHKKKHAKSSRSVCAGFFVTDSIWQLDSTNCSFATHNDTFMRPHVRKQATGRRTDTSLSSRCFQNPPPPLSSRVTLPVFMPLKYAQRVCG